MTNYCVECGDQCAEPEDGREPLCDECKGNGPAMIQCSYPTCQRKTRHDDIYGDLCSQHVRAENE